MGISSIEIEPDARVARDLLTAAAREAGTVALGYFRRGAQTSAAVQSKSGGSPVTAADFAADAVLKERLTAAFPGAGWLSEETEDNADRLNRRTLIIVDPIDGTRAFVAGDPRWTVCAALILDGRPIAGVVHAPALDETFSAARGQGALLGRERIAARPHTDKATLSAAGPKPTLQAMAQRLGLVVDVVPRVPSLAYRLCMAAHGDVDFAVAAADSHDWDIAAADIILEEAGAQLSNTSGDPVVYNTAKVRRKSLLAAPNAMAPRLLGAFRGALGD